jgi:hypothetical protein
MRRHAVGIIAVLLLLGAVAFWIWPAEGEGHPALEAACWRVGALMAVLWAAWPDIGRLPRWMAWAIPVLVVLLALRPRWFLLAIPILIVLAILKPRTTSRR